jgi:hypothetical protein
MREIVGSQMNYAYICGQLQARSLQDCHKNQKSGSMLVGNAEVEEKK